MRRRCALALVAFLVGVSTPALADYYQDVCADMDGDGELSSNDVTLLRWTLFLSHFPGFLPETWPEEFFVDGDPLVSIGCKPLPCFAGTKVSDDGTECVLDPSSAVVQALAAAALIEGQAAGYAFGEGSCFLFTDGVFQVAATGDCIPITAGCTNPTMPNFSSSVNVDDGSCDCESGYLLDDDECVDIDECAADPTTLPPGVSAPACDTNAVCVNDDGSAHCECGQGYAGSGAVCVPVGPGSCSSVTQCDDLDVCTTDTCDASLGCVNATGTFDCNDDNPCTDDVCAPDSGCSNAANAASCDDGDACTLGDVCNAGTCAGVAVVGCEVESAVVLYDGAFGNGGGASMETPTGYVIQGSIGTTQFLGVTVDGDYSIVNRFPRGEEGI